MDERQLHTHIPIVGWLLVAQSVILLLIAAFLLVLLVGVGFAIHDQTATSILTTVGFSLAIFLILLSLPGLVAGGGLIAKKGWSRTLAIVVAILGLFNIPIGTLIGGYAVWILLQDKASEYFAASSDASI